MAIYYVDPVNGNNANSGLSLANAWATLAHALSFTYAAGDRVLLCRTAVETTNSTLDLPSSGVSNVQFIGANSIGEVDGTRYTIRASTSMTNLINANAIINGRFFFNIDFDADSVATNAVNNNADSGAFVGFNCVIRNATQHGFRARGQGHVFYGSRFTNNGLHGLVGVTSNRAHFQLYGCSIDNNGSSGLNNSSGNQLYFDCVFFNNAGYGVTSGFNYGGWSIKNCTFFNNSSGGVNLGASTSAHSFSVSNCIFANNGGWALLGGFLGVDSFNLVDNNCFHSNASGIFSGGSLTYFRTIISDPLFVNVGAGTEDLRLQASSPCIGKGITGDDIGAYQYKASSGASRARVFSI